MWKARNAHDAVLAQQHIDPPKTASVWRNIRFQVLEHTLKAVGGRAGLSKIKPRINAVRVIPQVHRDHGLIGVDIDLHRDLKTLRQKRLHRIVAAAIFQVAPRQFGNSAGRPSLGIIKPVTDKVAHPCDTVFFDQFLQSALANSCCTNLREVVPIPLFGNTNTSFAHSNNVFIVRIIPLHQHTRENQRALGINILGLGRIGGRNTVATIRLMPFDGHIEKMLLTNKDWDDDGPVRRVGIAVIRVVVKIGVALAEIRVNPAHGSGLEVSAKNMRRDAFRRRQQLVFSRNDGARKIPRLADDRRARGAHHNTLHLAQYCVDAICHDGQLHWVQLITIGGINVRHLFRSGHERL